MRYVLSMPVAHHLARERSRRHYMQCLFLLTTFLCISGIFYFKILAKAQLLDHRIPVLTTTVTRAVKGNKDEEVVKSTSNSSHAANVSTTVPSRQYSHRTMRFRSCKLSGPGSWPLLLPRALLLQALECKACGIRRLSVMARTLIQHHWNYRVGLLLCIGSTHTVREL